MQLGNSSISYMQVRVSYAHSAFPEDCRPETMMGISSTRSRMETVVMATLKRHSTISLWCPRPTPAPNHLFQLIERHWGVNKAQEAMQKILAQRSTPRKAAQAGLGVYQVDMRSSLDASSTDSRSSSCYEPPVVPVRQASLHGMTETKTTRSHRVSSIHTRQNSTLSRQLAPAGDDGQERQGSRVDRESGRSTYWSDGSPSSQSGVSGHDRRMPGSDGLRGLVPRLADLTLEARERTSRGIAATARIKGKKELGRWGWASWFTS
jgi:hypothetical protein